MWPESAGPRLWRYLGSPGPSGWPSQHSRCPGRRAASQSGTGSARQGAHEPLRAPGVFSERGTGDLCRAVQTVTVRTPPLRAEAEPLKDCTACAHSHTWTLTFVRAS